MLRAKDNFNQDKVLGNLLGKGLYQVLGKSIDRKMDKIFLKELAQILGIIFSKLMPKILVSSLTLLKIAGMKRAKKVSVQLNYFLDD